MTPQEQLRRLQSRMEEIQRHNTNNVNISSDGWVAMLVCVVGVVGIVIAIAVAIISRERAMLLQEQTSELRDRVACRLRLIEARQKLEALT